MRIAAPLCAPITPFHCQFFSSALDTNSLDGREHDRDKMPALPIARPGRGRQNRGAGPDRNNQPQKARAGWRSSILFIISSIDFAAFPSTSESHMFTAGGADFGHAPSIVIVTPGQIKRLGFGLGITAVRLYLIIPKFLL
jgi:hypothetical protein